MKQLGCIVPVSFIALLVALVVSVSASEPKYPAPTSISCWKIHGYMLLYGQSAAYTWAAARYTQDQIQAIRYRCKLNWNG